MSDSLSHTLREKADAVELDENLGVADGQEVEIQVTVLPPARKWDEGILRTAGDLADDHA